MKHSAQPHKAVPSRPRRTPAPEPEAHALHAALAAHCTRAHTAHQQVSHKPANEAQAKPHTVRTHGNARRPKAPHETRACRESAASRHLMTGRGGAHARSGLTQR